MKHLKKFNENKSDMKLEERNYSRIISQVVY